MPQHSVLFYCNADASTGFGHLMRCLAIAQETNRRGWNVVVAGHFSDQAQALAAGTIPRLRLEAMPKQACVAEINDLVDRLRPSVIHLDCYVELLDGVATQGAILSNAQDDRFGRRPADLAIDANLGAEFRWEAGREEPVPLLGTSVVQIRDEVRALTHRVRSTLETPLKVLVVLGGTDPNAVTPVVVQALGKANESLELTVVCREQLHDAVRAAFASSNSNLTLLSFAERLPELANQHDFVITAAGTSTWDFAAMGLPMGLISVVDNQVQGYETSVKAELALPLGIWPGDDLEQRISCALHAVADRNERDRLSARGKTLVDGLGTWRIVSAWEQLLAVHPESRTRRNLSGPMVARQARLEDAQLLLDWRNDPLTRSVSRNSEEIDWGAHVDWVSRTIASPNRQLLIVESEGAAWGTARWDRLSHDSWEVSITVSPAKRGEGLSAGILRAAEEALESENPTRLIAAIHSDNTASRALFARANYMPFSPADENGFASYAKWRF